MDGVNKVPSGTVVGHLLEYIAQITEAYFADSGFKDVPDMGKLDLH